MSRRRSIEVLLLLVLLLVVLELLLLQMWWDVRGLMLLRPLGLPWLW
jgi:hypothetical protein